MKKFYCVVFLIISHSFLGVTSVWAKRASIDQLNLREVATIQSGDTFAPQPETFTYDSGISSQPKLEALFYSAKYPKAFIVYLHGGGCQRLRGHDDLTYFNQTKQALLDANYSVVVLDYTNGVDITGLFRARGITASMACETAVNTQLLEIDNVLPQIRAQRNVSVPMILLGHSYGGYLTNLLVSDPRARAAVDGFVSYEGVWDASLLRVANIDLDISLNVNPLSRSPILRGPLLVIQTEDDPVVPIQQLDFLIPWAEKNQSSAFELLRIKNGGHLPTSLATIDSVVAAIDHFTDEIIKR